MDENLKDRADKFIAMTADIASMNKVPTVIFNHLIKKTTLLGGIDDRPRVILVNYGTVSEKVISVREQNMISMKIPKNSRLFCII